MNTYSEEEIKAWFDEKIKKYSNTPTKFHLEHVKDLMFDEMWWKHENLKKVQKNS